MVNTDERALAAYPRIRQMTTRWFDNDAFGHMNNAVHYQFFDTSVNLLLRDLGEMQAPDGATRFVVAETGCRYFAEMAYPDAINVGLRVGHIGRSSVRYDLGLFRNDERTASAVGFLVHVNTAQKKPCAIGRALRAALERYRGPSPQD